MGRNDDVPEYFWNLNEKVIDTSVLFLRSVILLNGGAAVAVLGFVAAIAEADTLRAETISGVAEAIAIFAFGAAAGVLAIAVAYLTTYAALASFIHRESQRERLYSYGKRALHVVAAGLSLSGVGLFVVGVLAVKAAIVAGLA